MRTLPVLPELPPMRCDAGCRLCCDEAVPVTEEEMVRVVLYANERGIEPQESDPGMCVWYQDGRCAVYEARPLVCQAFGHHPALDCERGYNANVADPEELERVIVKAGPRTRFLHEVRKTGSMPVLDSVWDVVQANRKQAGLPPLRGKEEEHG